MWTLEDRPRYGRRKLRNPSDLTDEEWGLIGPLIPPEKKGGNKRTMPFLLKLYADSGYQERKSQQALRRICAQIDVEIVKRSDAGKSIGAVGWPRTGSA
jgi:transposase